ncbi:MULTISPECIES: hypothetical protein [Proteus]|uniref:hypothetical protein n=1 Tax=Proteus TaxID=583 RepID=UPI001C5FA532|nr:hypothetical protein [Proteus terrae]
MIDKNLDANKNNYIFLFSILILLSLYSVNIYSRFKFSDAALIIYIIVSIIKFKRIYIDTFNSTYFLWLFLVLLFSFTLINNNYFSYENFTLSFFRASLGVLSGFFIPLWLKTKEDKLAGIHALKSIIVLHVFIQFSFFILFYSGITNIFNIIPHGNQFNRGEWLNIYNYTNYFRFGGIFEEPSWYCWFMIFSIGIIITYEKNNNITIVNSKLFLMVFFSFILTFSISGLVSFLVLGLIKLRLIKISIRTIIFITLIMIASICIYYQINDTAFFERLTLVISGNDNSSNNRIMGSFDRLYYVMKNNSFGTGLGNSNQGINFYSNLEGVNLGDSTSNQNGFFEPFISTGLICGILYLAPIIKLIFNKNTIFIFVTISLVFFTTSAIYNSTMWFFIFLSYYLTQQFNENRD